MRYSYNKNKRKLNYMILIIMILVISIGYAVLSTNLNIIGAGTINSPTWNIHWENVQVKTGSVSASTPTIDTAKTTVNYSVELTTPGDFYEFTVDAVNAGSIDGMVSVVTSKMNGTEITTLPNYFEYKISYVDGVAIAPNQILSAGSSEKYKIHIGYKKNINQSDIPEGIQTLNLSFSVTYVQTDTNVLPVPHLETVYTINDFDYADEDNTVIWMGKAIPTFVTQYSNAQDAKAEFNNTFYLKHELENGIVKDSYVCFEYNNNIYCLKGQQTWDNSTNTCNTHDCISSYYQSNKNILKEAFGESNCVENNRFECNMSEKRFYARDDGQVGVLSALGDCYVLSDGRSFCDWWN